MKKAIQKIDGVCGWIAALFESIAAFFLSAFSILVFLQVLTRFVFRSPLAWSEELARFAFISMVYAGCVVGVRRCTHYYISVFTAKLSPKGQRITSILSILVQALFFLFLTKTSMDFFMVMKTNLAPVTRISMSIPYLGIVVFSVVGLLLTIEQLLMLLSDPAYQLKRTEEAV